MSEDQNQFLLKEYELLWAYITHLHRERRDAVRFLLAALPGVPAAVYGVVHLWGKEQSSLDSIAPWMSLLLGFLWVIGILYFLVMTSSRINAVDYTRKLNITRKYLIANGLNDYKKELLDIDSHWLCADHPKYHGLWRTDFWYSALVVFADSVVAGAFGYFLSALRGWGDGLNIGCYFLIGSFFVLFAIWYFTLRKRPCESSQQETLKDGCKVKRP